MRTTSDDILLYLLNTSVSLDIILIETPFHQFSIASCSELSVCICLCVLFNLSSYKNVHYVELCNYIIFRNRNNIYLSLCLYLFPFIFFIYISRFCFQLPSTLSVFKEVRINAKHISTKKM